MATLVLLNGPSASGKSTLAARFIAEHPMALNLDVDVIRGLLGRRIDQPVDASGVIAAANRVRAIFGSELVGPIRTALDDLRDNFGNLNSQGPNAYADQTILDHPELDGTTLRADAVTAIDQFHRQLLQG